MAIRNDILAFLKDSLLTNSVWIILDAFMLSLFGFVFWIVNARLYSSEIVGMSSAFISLAEMIIALSLLGFDVSLIKYLPANKERGKMLNSVFILSTLLAVLFSILVILYVSNFIPKFQAIKNISFLLAFVLFTYFGVFSKLAASVFIAEKNSHFVFVKDLGFNILKVTIPFAVVGYGIFGIFSSWLAGLICAAIISLFLLKHSWSFHISGTTIKQLFNFSSVNYCNNFLAQAPEVIMPLIIAGTLGSNVTAYFYISYMICSIIFIIPISASKSLLAHSTPATFQPQLRKVMTFTGILILPMIAVLFIIAEPLLLLFGSEYSTNAASLLRLFLLGSIPFAINTIYITTLNISHKLSKVIGIQIMLSISIITLSYYFIAHGVIVTALIWFLAQALVAVYSALQLRRLAYG